MNHKFVWQWASCRMEWSSPHLFETGTWICGAAHARTGVSGPHKHCHTQTDATYRRAALSRFFAAKGPLTTPVFQEELVRSESGQRASSITDSM